MENIFTIIVVILAALAVSDLIVGVSNDATNFLNSALGSRVAPRYVIMGVASIGILLGSMFSSGMMEVARSGVFFPAMYSFSDVMMLFLAVMFTDVILLDLFNTFGLPTSTTVSLVFELLGSAVAVAVVKIWNSPEGAETLAQYINASKAMGIISGILMSVVIAFVCGTIIMYITRIIFSFRYHKIFRYIGSLWCGMALTAISYFVLFKGLKGTTLLSGDTIGFLNDNVGVLMLGFFISWSVLMAIIQHLFRFNILKIAILAGTFSLALAFAGNDLVNFIGVFMAGYDSYAIALQSQDVNMTMEALSNPVKANVLILFGAGAVMILTLWFSKKARRVSETELSLSRQDADGAERFGSTTISRAIVRSALNFNKKIEQYIPARVHSFIARRFEPIESDEKAPFDLIRATVNLTVASLLISMATSLKLPLSTTYVTFMVAMGSSLSDKAWGRESAVYRITGVLTVISGWFLTAFIAFTVAFIVAMVLMYGQSIAVIGISVLCVFILYQGSVSQKRRARKKSEELHSQEGVIDGNIVAVCQKEIRDAMQKVTHVYDQTLAGLFNEDRRLLRTMMKESEELYTAAHKRKSEVHNTLSALEDNYISNGHYYVQVVDYINEVTKALVHITRPSFEHIDNNHTGFSQDQVKDLKEIEEKVTVIYGMINHMLKTGDYSKIDQTLYLRDSLFEEFAQVIKRQIARIKTGETSTRGSMLYLDIIGETKTMILQSRNLLKAQKHFVSK